MTNSLSGRVIDDDAADRRGRAPCQLHLRVARVSLQAELGPGRLSGKHGAWLVRGEDEGRRPRGDAACHHRRSADHSGGQACYCECAQPRSETPSPRITGEPRLIDVPDTVNVPHIDSETGNAGVDTHLAALSHDIGTRG